MGCCVYLLLVTVLLQCGLLSAPVSVFFLTAVGSVGQLTKVLSLIKQEICLRVKKPFSSDGEKLTSKLNNLIKNHLS